MALRLLRSVKILNLGDFSRWWFEVTALLYSQTSVLVLWIMLFSAAWTQFFYHNYILMLEWHLLCLWAFRNPLTCGVRCLAGGSSAGAEDRAAALLSTGSRWRKRWGRAWVCTLIFLSSFALLVTVSFCLDISRFYNSRFYNSTTRVVGGPFVIKLIRFDPKLALCNSHLMSF